MVAIKPQGGDRTGPRLMPAQTEPLAGVPSCHWPTPAVETAFLVSGDWPPGRGHASVRWACFPETGTSAPVVRADQVRGARDFTVGTLRRWGVDERCDDVAVVVSELLTNALRHALPAVAQAGAGWPVQLGLLQRGRCVTCAVENRAQMTFPPSPEAVKPHRSLSAAMTCRPRPVSARYPGSPGTGVTRLGSATAHVTHRPR